MMNPTIRTYTELISFNTFEDRFNYLKLSGEVGASTFGYERYLNQKFYHSPEWRKIRREIIIRDSGNDMGLNDYSIVGKIYIHHLNPIRTQDIVCSTAILMNPEFLICVSYDTHQAIHYGDIDLLNNNFIIERTKNDTCPWK